MRRGTINNKELSNLFLETSNLLNLLIFLPMPPCLQCGEKCEIFFLYMYGL